MPKVVIIIEDEPDTTEMFAEMMQLSGFEVVEKVYSGEISMDELAAMCPSVVILDWMLPVQSGITLLRQMRADARLRETPVIMVSARSQAEDVAEALRAGATVFLPKPVSFDDLRQAVLSVIDAKDA